MAVEVTYFFPKCPRCGRESVPDRDRRYPQDWAYRCPANSCRINGLPLRFRTVGGEVRLVGWYG